MFWRRVYPQTTLYSPLQTPCVRLFEGHLASVIFFLGFFQECKTTHLFTLPHVSVAGWQELLHDLCQSTHPAASWRNINGLDRCFDHCSELFFLHCELEMLQKMHNFMILVYHCTGKSSISILLSTIMFSWKMGWSKMLVSFQGVGWSRQFATEPWWDQRHHRQSAAT